LQRLVAPIEKAIEDAGITVDKLQNVEIIGGATRVRAVKKYVAKILGLDQSKPNYGLSTTQNADECISRGCALRCAILSPAFRVKEFIVSDTVAFPIKLTWEQKEAIGEDADGNNGDEEDEGMNASGQNSIVIFGSGCEVPKTRRVTFRRTEEFDIVSSYDISIDGFDSSLATFTIGGMPSIEDPETLPRIRVEFRYDDFGLFGVKEAKLLQEIKEEPPAPEAAAEEKEEDAVAKAKEAKEGDEAKQQEEAKPKKKKFKSITLKVTSKYDRAFSSTDISNLRDEERGYCAADKVLEETSAKRNELEEYVYSMRDNIISNLKDFATSAEAESFSLLLEKTEAWVYDEGFDETMEVYQAKLKEVSDIGNKFSKRHFEHEHRGAAVTALQDTVGQLLGVVNSPDEKYAHIDEEEREKVRKSCAEAEQWLNEMNEKQKALNLYEDPVLLIADIEIKTNDVTFACKPIVNKKKPAPPPKQEEKPPSSPKNPGEEKKEADTTAPMEEEENNDEAKEKDTNMDVD
jgi:heat shock protein 4